MDSNDQICVEPTTAPHPGEVICDYLEFYGWSQRDLARRTQLTPKTISEICNRKAAIKPHTALKLERVFQRPAHLWLNLQRQFDETLARQQMILQSQNWIDWARKFPLKEMKKLQFSLEATQSDVDALLNYFGVSSPESWNSVWEAFDVSYRQTRKFKKSKWAISAWVRETELLATQIEMGPYNEQRLLSIIGKLRGFTRKRVEEALGPVQELCALAGVAVVWVPELPHSGISGCARWLPDKKALIGLTLRYKTDDQMWFSFFHELGHLLLHKNKRSFVVDNAAKDLSDRVIDPEMQKYEAEANQFAADTLVPPSALTAFVRAGIFSNESIHEFAEEIGIGPGILVGRLQHDGYLGHHQGNALKQKLDWRLKQAG
ncbi:MAG: HigA family addiction module antitoxin [Chloroflexota bacterium]|nr:HigA family addiction module antitoxin [Chloroflexota bacterium]